MDALGLNDTHGILRRPGCERRADSQNLNWSSAFASTQAEQPYEDSFAAVRSHLIILHLNNYVKVDRWTDGKHASHLVPPGGTFIIPGGTDFRVRLGGGLSTVHVYLRDDVIAEVARDLSLSSQVTGLVPRLGERDPLLETLLLGVRDELLDPGLMGDGYVDYLARAAAARLLRLAMRSKPLAPEVGFPGAPSSKVARAIDYLDAHLHRAVSLDELATLLGMSVSQTIQLFKKTVGMPPHRFILSRRVARARDLLKRRDLPLVDVALICGFSHQEHLGRVFKRETKQSPGAYRRSLGLLER